MTGDEVFFCFIPVISVSGVDGCRKTNNDVRKNAPRKCLGRYEEATADFRASLEISDEFKQWINDFLQGRVEQGDQEAAQMIEILELL